jgi:hypothetical protein
MPGSARRQFAAAAAAYADRLREPDDAVGDGRGLRLQPGAFEAARGPGHR